MTRSLTGDSRLVSSITLRHVTLIRWWRRQMNPSQTLIWLAGAALILAGILCLCLSGAVFTGWWQGTLGAFGVGFTVGGIVDVLAIFALNQSVTTEDRQMQENNQQAREIFLAELKKELSEQPESEKELSEQRMRAASLLMDCKGLIDPQFADQLVKIAFGEVPPDQMAPLLEFLQLRVPRAKG